VAPSRRGSQSLLDFARPQTAWKPPRLSELPSTWAGVRRIAFDLETCDPQLKSLGIGCRRDGYIVGYSFAIEDGPAFYVPMRHALGGNVEAPDSAWQYIIDRMWEFQGTLVTHGGAYDIDYLTTFGGRLNPKIKHRDTALNAALINEWAGKFDLDSCLERHDLEPKDESLLDEAAAAYGVDAKKDLWRLPGDLVGPYGTRDVTGPLQLLRKQETIIEEENLWEAVETESSLLPVVVRMRQRGVKVDEDRLAQFGRWAEKKREFHLASFRSATGIRSFGLDDFRSAQKLDAIVRQVTGKPLPRTEKGNPKTDAATLASIKHPAFVHLNDAKSVDTVLKTFYKGTVEHLIRGRIHATFKQLVGARDGADDESEGAAFGRMACSHTNMQNQPNPEKAPEIGGRWRSIYVPDIHNEWVCADYSQQEPRWGIHWSEFLNLPGAKIAGDMLRANPALDPYAPMVQETGLKRGVVKILYLALTYNMSEVTLCRNLGLPVERYEKYGKWKLRAGPEGRAIIDRMNSRAPYIGMLRDEAARRARQRGFIMLFDGRRCRFVRDEHGNVQDDGVALNRLLQGSAGVQTKKMLIEADRQGLPLQTVVHDDTSLSGHQYADLLVEIMQNVVKTSVPMRAKRKIGKDYADASGYGVREILGEDGSSYKEEFRPLPDAPASEFMEAWAWVRQGT
jgi:DNA polymerase I-like protein with 3'-5' exonuclease and polymerase domains